MSKRKRKGKYKSRKELIEIIHKTSRLLVEYILKNNELHKQLIEIDIKAKNPVFVYKKED